MKKIMFHLNCLEQGGAERVVSNLANQFASQGYEVIVATQWQGEQEFQLNREVRRIHVGLSAEDECKSRLKKIFLRIKYLRTLLKQEKPDVAIAFAHNAIYRTLFAALNNKIPTVIAVRINPVGNYDGLVDKLLIPFLYRRADGSVFQTAQQRDFFPEFIRRNAAIIINPINSKYTRVQENPISFEQRSKTIVHSSRIVDFKNQLMLVRAFLRVHEKYPDYDLKLYGPDSHDGTWQKLEELIARNRATEYIHLMGPSDSLEKELPKGRIYVLSSDYEGMPNALLEAMALGLPVISTDCPPGAPADLIEDGVNGLLVPVGDEQALANSIITLIEQPELAQRLGEEATKIRERANVEIIYEQWKTYLEQVIAGSGKKK